MAHQTERQTNFARSLRKKDNTPEAIMWAEVRGRRLHGMKFVRELPIGNFFADFACREKRLIVEIDGSQHTNSSNDNDRDYWLNSSGWSVLRFLSLLVLKEKETVLRILIEVLEERIYQKEESNEWRYWPKEVGPEG